jgi:hypothetical protein
MTTRHRQAAWTDGADRLRVSEMYRGRAQDGIVFHVEQRTTGTGRAVLLMPDRVREVIEWLTARLAEAEGQRPYPGRRPTERESVPGECECIYNGSVLEMRET